MKSMCCTQGSILWKGSGANDGCVSEQVPTCADASAGACGGVDWESAMLASHMRLRWSSPCSCVASAVLPWLSSCSVLVMRVSLSCRYCTGMPMADQGSWAGIMLDSCQHQIPGFALPLYVLVLVLKLHLYDDDNVLGE